MAYLDLSHLVKESTVGCFCIAPKNNKTTWFQNAKKKIVKPQPQDREMSFSFTSFLFLTFVTLTSLCNATMTCDEGYTAIFDQAFGVHFIQCCAYGVATNGKQCKNPSQADYQVSCYEIFPLAFNANCSCGLSCSGSVAYLGYPLCIDHNCSCDGAGSECNFTEETRAPTLRHKSTLPPNVSTSPKAIFSSLMAILFSFFLF